ncbi:hypothetical protein [Okeania sp. SIO2B3]|uniref:hypothetical protein n=1 Tax=Okeania sp. SIO2B3 TaxID=2607784 RepID=UPI0013C0D922|nr:hypothetical protein [Okeania sp. SIO2B3]NET44819.1 hypothetical protein [Okeania sp. SIO2B3]
MIFRLYYQELSFSLKLGSFLLLNAIAEGRRQKAEGRRQKAEGGRKNIAFAV